MNNLWTYRGRLNRQPYFFRLLVAAAIIVFVKRGAIPNRSQFDTLGILLLVVFVSTALIFINLQHIQRLHDLDKSGWYSILMFVPLVNFVFGLYLAFTKGTDGSNQYGEDPLAPENAGKGT